MVSQIPIKINTQRRCRYVWYVMVRYLTSTSKNRTKTSREGNGRGIQPKPTQNDGQLEWSLVAGVVNLGALLCTAVHTWYQGSSALSSRCSRSVPSALGFSRCLSRASPVDGRLAHNTVILPPTCPMTLPAAVRAGPRAHSASRVWECI